MNLYNVVRGLSETCGHTLRGSRKTAICTQNHDTRVVGRNKEGKCNERVAENTHRRYRAQFPDIKSDQPRGEVRKLVSQVRKAQKAVREWKEQMLGQTNTLERKENNE